jgi:hypothetical protein
MRSISKNERLKRTRTQACLYYVSHRTECGAAQSTPPHRHSIIATS